MVMSVRAIVQRRFEICPSPFQESVQTRRTILKRSPSLMIADEIKVMCGLEVFPLGSVRVLQNVTLMSAGIRRESNGLRAIVTLALIR